MKQISEDQKTALIKAINKQGIEIASKIKMGEITSINDAHDIMYTQNDVIAQFFKQHLDIIINERNFNYIAGGYRNIQRMILEDLEKLITPSAQP